MVSVKLVFVRVLGSAMRVTPMPHLRLRKPPRARFFVALLPVSCGAAGFAIAFRWSVSYVIHHVYRLDTAAISALAPINQQARARLRALRERVDDFVVPAAVLAEGMLSGHPGHDYHVGRLLNNLSVATIDQLLGMAAGSMRSEVIRAGVDPPPSGVDALVVGLRKVDRSGRHTALGRIAVLRT